MCPPPPVHHLLPSTLFDLLILSIHIDGRFSPYNPMELVTVSQHVKITEKGKHHNSRCTINPFLDDKALYMFMTPLLPNPYTTWRLDIVWKFQSSILGCNSHLFISFPSNNILWKSDWCIWPTTILMEWADFQVHRQPLWGICSIYHCFDISLLLLKIDRFCMHPLWLTDWWMICFMKPRKV